MIKVNKDIENKIEEFVHSYIAGSCVEFSQASSVLLEEFTNNVILFSLDELEDLLAQAIADAELFCCENCGWWCYEHDRSSEGTYCADCEDEDNE